jgi:pilus assembly protein CpaB
VSAGTPRAGLPPRGASAAAGSRAPAGRRRTGLRAAGFTAVAAVAAIAAALLLTRYLDRRTDALRIPTVKVVVAAVDLPIATALRPDVLAIVDWPAASKPAGAFSDLGPLRGRVVVTPVFQGEAILAPKLASTDAGSGLAALLPAGMRAVAVRVDDVVGIAGFLRPGDQVDVIVTMKPSEGGTVPPVSKIVLQSVRVLAVGKDIAQRDRNQDKPVAATVATLMVDAPQSEKLALAATKGQILLALRSRVDTETAATSGITPPALLAGAPVISAAPPAAPPPPRAVPVAARGRSARPAPAPAAAPARAPEQMIEILRGDLYERRGFQEKEKEKERTP